MAHSSLLKKKNRGPHVWQTSPPTTAVM